MSLDKLKLISEALIELGIKKIRITGGEPLVEKDILQYFQYLSEKLKEKMIDELLLTTNGTQLKNMQKNYLNLGLKE